mgnify:FL=1
MSAKSITTKCNLDSGVWSVDTTLLSHISNQIAIGFENNAGNTVIFNKLSFSYKITDNANSAVIVDKSYPPTGIVYEESDSSFMVIDMLDLVPGHEYTLNLSATNNTKTVSYTHLRAHET